jgi:hypothetical protein
MKTVEKPLYNEDLLESAMLEFLSAPLPEDFSPDGGVFLLDRVDSSHLSGTNLLTYKQVHSMLRHAFIVDDVAQEEIILEHVKRQGAEIDEYLEALDALFNLCNGDNSHPVYLRFLKHLKFLNEDLNADLRTIS